MFSTEDKVLFVGLLILVALFFAFHLIHSSGLFIVADEPEYTMTGPNCAGVSEEHLKLNKEMEKLW